MSTGGTFSPLVAPFSPGAKRGAMISRDKLPCTRIAAVVGAQRDRVAWLLFISTGSWLEYILPSAHTPATPRGPTRRRLPFSGTSSWRSLGEVRRRENRKRKLGGFFMGKMVANFALLRLREAGRKGNVAQIQHLSPSTIETKILFFNIFCLKILFQSFSFLIGNYNREARS